MGQTNSGFKLTDTSKRPAIFYIPHPDDEAIGMAGSIMKHKEAGDPVYLVLLTNGHNTKTFQLLNGYRYCNVHNTYHKFDISMEQLMWLRRVEFISSARKLGVDKVFIINDGRGIEDLNDTGSEYNSIFIRNVRTTILRFYKIFPTAVHHFTSGPDDSFVGRDGLGEPKINAAHLACWKAAMSIKKYRFERIFHRIYIYTYPVSNRISTYKLELNGEWKDKKNSALSQYQLFIPEADRFAIGYHSVPYLFESAISDQYEYIST